MSERTEPATSKGGPLRSLEAIRLEAEADAREFAAGCDDLAAAIQRALWARKVDKTDLQDALNRYHLRLQIIERGLHLIPEDSASNGTEASP